MSAKRISRSSPRALTRLSTRALRHHRTERHLRRDQRWRYDHNRPITGNVQHRVRGGNGKILTKMELAKELPKFTHAELVDIGERFLFYEDFVKGSSIALVTPEARTKIQPCLVEDVIKSQGDLMVLRILWSRMGSFKTMKPYSATLIGAKKD